MESEISPSIKLTSWERRDNYRGSSELFSAIIVSANAKMQLKCGANILLAAVFSGLKAMHTYTIN